MTFQFHEKLDFRVFTFQDVQFQSKLSLLAHNSWGIGQNQDSQSSWYLPQRSTEGWSHKNQPWIPCSAGSSLPTRRIQGKTPFQHPQPQR